MRLAFPLCTVGVTSLSLWAMGAVVTPGKVGLPAINESSVAGTWPDQETSPPPTGFGLGGRVVDAATGRPVQGARVTASSDDTGGSSGSTNTSQQGAWRLNGLASASYHVMVQKAGYQTRYSGLPLVSLTDDRPQRVLNLTLARGSVISGRISDSSGRPAVDVRVGVLRVLPGTGDPTFQFEWDIAQTDAAGNFRLSDLRDGEYVLAAMARGPGLTGDRSRRSHITTFYPTATVALDAHRLKVHDGTVRANVDITLKSAPTFQVSGHVTSSRGEPIDATISFEYRDDAFSPNGSTSYGPQGGRRFALTGLVAGRYRIRARTSPGKDRPETGTVDVAIGDRDITDLEIRTEPAVIVRGRVVTDSRYDTWQLDWMRLGGMPVDRRESSDAETATVRADRTFELETHHAPARIVAFQPLGGWEIKTVRWAGREAVDGVLSAGHGDIISDVEVVLQRRTGIVDGTVRDASDCTYVIVLQRTEAGKVACAASSPVRDREFRTLPLVAGHYRVIATHGPFPVTPARLWDMATPVTLIDDRTVTLNLAAKGHH